VERGAVHQTSAERIVTITSDLLATAAAIVSILTALFAAPLLLGVYVVVQRTSMLTHLVWFGVILMLLAGALLAGAFGLILTG
jgi:hypothetical protein